MKENLPKISRATNIEDINWCLEENYNEIYIDWFPILAKWLDNSYAVFKDHETKKKLIELYNTIYDFNYKVTTNCRSCLSTVHNGIKKIYDEYKK